MNEVYKGHSPSVLQMKTEVFCLFLITTYMVYWYTQKCSIRVCFVFHMKWYASGYFVMQ